MIRSCVICRKKSNPNQLLRLSVNPEKQLVPVSNSHQGRCTWLCFKMSCINQLQDKPRRANRVLKTSVTGTANLLKAAQQQLNSQIEKELIWAYRSGLIRIIENCANDFQKKANLIIHLNSREQPLIEMQKNDALHLILDINFDKIVGWTGPKDMQMIAVLPNRRLPLLTRYLRVAIGLR